MHRREAICRGDVEYFRLLLRITRSTSFSSAGYESNRAANRGWEGDLFSIELLLVFPELFTVSRAVSQFADLPSYVRSSVQYKQFFYRYVFFIKIARGYSETGPFTANYYDRSARP